MHSGFKCKACYQYCNLTYKGTRVDVQYKEYTCPEGHVTRLRRQGNDIDVYTRPEKVNGNINKEDK